MDFRGSATQVVIQEREEDLGRCLGIAWKIVLLRLPRGAGKRRQEIPYQAVYLPDHIETGPRPQQVVAMHREQDERFAKAPAHDRRMTAGLAINSRRPFLILRQVQRGISLSEDDASDIEEPP
jgi:hypothetical protein